MQIRTKLTLQFLLSGGILFILASITIYYFSSNFRERNFYNRLKYKALSTANLLFKEYEVDAPNTKKIERQNPIDLHNEMIIILNSKHDTIYNSDHNSKIKIDKEIIRQIESGYNVTGKQGIYELIGVLYFTNYDIFIIIAAANDIEGYKHLEKLSTILITVCISSILLFFIIGWFYAGRAIKPISNIVNKVENISATRLNLRLSEGKKHDEIGRLAKTFNKMLERLEISFSSQKNFIANASHELRTPLTSINGQLEVLLMKDRTIEEYKTELNSVLYDIKSLIDLANRLLLMARSNSETPMKLNKKIRIDEILWQIKEEMQKFNKGYIINILINSSLTDFDQMTVIGDEYMLKVAISNIIDNACKYSSNHKVNVQILHINKHLELEFIDTGIGISEEALQKVFEPFYRANNTYSIQGHGIGLPLANQIIKNHNGEIKIFSEINKGSRIIIKLPTIV